MNKVIVWGVAVAALIALLLTLAGRQGMLGEAPPPQSRVPIGGAFTLVNGAGETVTEADFAGLPALVFFGYTHCPDVCPTVLATLGAALDALGDEAARLQVLFISVDPARDTPDVVGAYVALFHPRIVGLTGSAEQVAAVTKTYRIYAAIPEDAGEDYTVDHSTVIYLMDSRGDYLANFSYTASVEEITAGLREHLD